MLSNNTLVNVAKYCGYTPIISDFKVYVTDGEKSELYDPMNNIEQWIKLVAIFSDYDDITQFMDITTAVIIDQEKLQNA